MPETPAISVQDLLDAAAALGLTNADVATRLGVDPPVFSRSAADAENGKSSIIQHESAKAHAAAARLLEEAGLTNGTDNDDVSNRATSSETGETYEDPRSRKPAEGSHSEHDAAADTDHICDDHAGNHADEQAEHADGEQADAPDYYNLDAAELIKQAAALAGPPDQLEKRARAIIKAAAGADMDAVEDDQLVEALAKSWKTGKRGIRGVLKAERAAYLASQRPTAEEHAARAADKAQAAADERQQREAELWASVSQLALDPQLLDRLLLYAAEAGIISEGPATLAVFLVAASRLLTGRALCLLRRGAPASGKNFVPDVITKLVPSEAIIQLNGTSSKALQYYGGEDENALVRKILYVPEAAGLARRHGDEPETVTMLRSLISEGEINYLTVVTREDGQSPITVNMKKKGPTALIMTSARDDVEEEMLTRLMMADSDETPRTTNRVVSDLHKRATGFRPPLLSNTTTVMWQDFQHWLALGGPFDVVIPFAEALRAAYASVPVPLRIRRDAGNILGAIKAAAVVHRAQRRLDPEGRIVAELADYEAVYRAFAPGLAALYRARASPGIIALVEALERIRAAADVAWQAQADQFAADNPGAPLPFDQPPPGSVSATYRQLSKELGINSLDTVGSRVRSALAEEVIEIVDAGIYGRAAPRRYRIKIGSAVLGSQASGIAVLPTPAAVQAMIDDPGAAAAAVARFDAEPRTDEAAATDAKADTDAGPERAP